jgi:hypothetical protein
MGKDSEGQMVSCGIHLEGTLRARGKQTCTSIHSSIHSFVSLARYIVGPGELASPDCLTTVRAIARAMVGAIAVIAGATEWLAGSRVSDRIAER